MCKFMNFFMYGDWWVDYMLVVLYELSVWMYSGDMSFRRVCVRDLSI